MYNKHYTFCNLSMFLSFGTSKIFNTDWASEPIFKNYQAQQAQHALHTISAIHFDSSQQIVACIVIRCKFTHSTHLVTTELVLEDPVKGNITSKLLLGFKSVPLTISTIMLHRICDLSLNSVP